MLGAGAMLRVKQIADRMPPWARPVVIGAVAPIFVAFPGVLGLVSLILILVLITRDAGWVALPIAIIVFGVATIAGGAGGLVYGVLSRVTTDRRGGVLLRWVGAMYAYLGVFWLACVAAPIPKSLEQHPAVLAALVITGLVFGLVLGWMMYEPSDPYEGLHGRGA